MPVRSPLIFRAASGVIVEGMKKHLLSLVAVFVGLAGHLQADDAGYLAADAIDPKAVLPNPPAPDSAVVEKEIELILQKQATRTEADLARYKSEENYNAYVLTGVVGKWFSPDNAAHISRTMLLLDRVAVSVAPIVAAAKTDWQRPRPFLQNSRIYPPVERPKDSSYPSGEATRAMLDALILGQLMPDAKAPLVARAAQVGDDGEVVGIYFPSDVAAGQKLALALFEKLMANPDFQNDLAEVKAEIVAERAKTQ
jgi:acid phosphatase (class A)